MKDITCSCCKETKSNLFFYYNKKAESYLSQCKECVKKRAKEYRENNKEAVADRIKRWIKNNPEKRKKICNKYAKKNKENLAKYSREYRIANQEKERERHRKYLEENNRYNKDYYKNNKEKIKANSLNYYYNNKESIRKQQKIRECEYRKNNINFKISHNIRKRVWDALNGICKSKSTVKLLGCSIDFFKKHLESQFTPEMSWDNYGPYWHIDHILPCAAFDLRHSEEQEICFAWWNMQPLEAIENIRKGASFGL